MKIPVKKAVKLGEQSTDGGRVALQFTDEGGRALILDFPIEGLEELSFFLAQLAHISRKQEGPLGRAPALPIERMDLGASDEGEIVLHLHYPKLGTRAFRFDRKLATELSDKLQIVLAQQTQIQAPLN